MLSSFSKLSGLLLGALFILPGLTFATSWEDPQWLRLLHYNKSLFGAYLSETDGRDFFLDPRGKISPEKELDAFKKRLSETSTDPDSHVYCRFPARWRWLKSQDPSFTDPQIQCPKLNAFRDRLGAKSLAVVFSSYYLNNPSSSFGHTFIRLGKTPHSVTDDKATTELLDTGINYGAVTGDANALVYTIGGLAGWFPGTFNAIPYYYKVREYNDFETRDLWSYQLNLNQSDIDMVVDHIWELGHSYFDYYFLTENCSYHVLSILEAARPDIQLLKHLPRLYTIPSDTLKVLKDEGLVSKVTFRPAPSTLFYHLLGQLNPQEVKLVKKISDDPGAQIDLPDDRKALVYDSALSLIDFKHAKEILKQEEKAQELKRPVLIARSKIPVRSPDPDFSSMSQSAPHLGHGSRRLTVGGSNRMGDQAMDVEWRYAFHDILDYDVAYPYRSKVEVGKFNFRTDGHKIQVRDISFIDLMSLGKWDIFNKSASWKLKMGQWQTRKNDRDLSTQGAQGGYGYSYHFDHLTPYLLAHGEGSYISERLRQIKLGYGADAGLLFDVSSSIKMNSILEWRGDPWDETRFHNELRFTNKDYGLGFYYLDYLSNGENEFGVKTHFYF